VPLPRIAYRLGDYIKAGLSAARAAHAEIFAAIGATEIQHWDAAEGAGHIMGTARMGADPKDSVVDRDPAATITATCSSSARRCFQRLRRPIPR
jgi:Choline dehydrogenase and related flavoproteins